MTSKYKKRVVPMEYSAMLKVYTIATLLALANAIPVSVSNTWSTLTPTGTLPESASAITSYSGSFALSIRTISASVSIGISVDKRDIVTQIADGQLQAASEAANIVAQITDGQLQQQTATPSTAEVVNQISDGQIQEQTATTADVVNQIDDGQLQQQSVTTADVVNQIGDGQIQQQTATTADVINQIEDGQIQQQSAAPTTTASVINQIEDGQIQENTKTTADVVSQIADGQIQATTVAGQASQIGDGQIQATGAAGEDSSSTSDGFVKTCVASNALTFSLTDGELRDAQLRVGAIVANRQFQFDGPPPQAGTIYAAGWAFVPASYAGANEDESDTIDTGYKLALGNQTTFFKCKSGDFYNLYDASIGGQCSEIEIFVLEVVDC